jgi:hypothetical protein
MRSVRTWAVAILSLFVAACGGSETITPDGGTPIDGALPDSGGALPDAAAADAEQQRFYVRQRDDGQLGSGTEADPFGDLQHAIDTVPSGARLVLRAGTYTTTIAGEEEELCGNCAEHQTRVQYKRAFTIREKSVDLEGVEQGAVRIVTRAGYGVLIERAPRVSIERLTITGGVRDENGDATSAAIVVRDSTVNVREVMISGNDDLREGNAYPGIAGIAGREGARLTVVGSVIDQNSWDGIALYRGARATVIDNVVAHSNGVGIAATWDADLIAINNRVTGYWKGIGGFGKSAVVARNNQIYEQLGWGMWAAGDEDSTMEMVNNVVARSGNCGIAINPSARGRAVNNIVAFNGTQDPWVCPKAGIWVFGPLTRQFQVAYNLIFGSDLGLVWRGGMQPGGDGGADVSAELIGMSGNFSMDPLFVGARDFHLMASSPAIDAGDPAIMDKNGSRSDLGHLGGPDAERTSP